MNLHKCACSKNNFGSCWMKSLTEIKLHPISSNTIQHCPTWCLNEDNMLWPTMLDDGTLRTKNIHDKTIMPSELKISRYLKKIGGGLAMGNNLIRYGQNGNSGIGVKGHGNSRDAHCYGYRHEREYISTNFVLNAEHNYWNCLSIVPTPCTAL